MNFTLPGKLAEIEDPAACESFFRALLVEIGSSYDMLLEGDAVVLQDQDGGFLIQFRSARAARSESEFLEAVAERAERI